MHRFQTAQENMNSASVEYVRGMSEIKAFNQTADSFKRLGKSITDYTSFVLEYALGWQNCMPAFTTIINNIYLLLIPVGILIGMHTTDFREYSLTFIFYLIIVHAISGVLNKIMYISESFTQIDGSVERMDEILRIPALPEKEYGASNRKLWDCFPGCQLFLRSRFPGQGPVSCFFLCGSGQGDSHCRPLRWR